MSTVGFPTSLVLKLTGVTDGTLEHWNDRDFLKPSVKALGRSGAPRVYSFRDLVAIRVIDELRTRGLDVRHLRGVLAHIRGRGDLELGRDIPANRTLITDGHTFMDLDAGVRSAEVLQPGQTPQVLLLVPLGVIVGQLQRDARALLAA